MPPVRDTVMLGKDSSISCEAMRKVLKILQPTEFRQIEHAPDDGMISDTRSAPAAQLLRSACVLKAFEKRAKTG